MDWFKKHVDAVIVLGGILTSVFWMNGKFHQIEKDLSEMKTELAVMKTVLIMKGLFPTELAAKEPHEKQ